MMKENRVDSYLRREDTLLAKGIARISSKRGSEWRQSQGKRKFDVTVSTPAWLLAAPVVGALKTAIRRTDNIDPSYRQSRLGQDLQESLVVDKLTTMKPGSEAPEVFGEKGLGHEDPRLTSLGAKVRKYELQELPQLGQVASGALTLVGIRPIHALDYAKLHEIRNGTGHKWDTAYSEGKPSVFHLQAALDKSRTDDNNRRYHYDIFYSKHASLGFDLYILYKNLALIAGKAFKRRPDQPTKKAPLGAISDERAA